MTLLSALFFMSPGSVSIALAIYMYFRSLMKTVVSGPVSVLTDSTYH